MDIENALIDMKDELIEIRRHLHHNPELSFQEYQTTEYLADILTKYGIKFKRIKNYTGIVALIEGENPGNTIALRADIDALPIEEQTGLEFSSKSPGIMHACGHDIHTTILVGSAILLNQFKKEIHGSIKFIFQPGEETQKGAKEIINQGVLQEPEVDALIALHTWPDLPSGTIGVRKGTMTAASDFVTISVNGKSGHAAHPETSVDPVVIAGHIISSLQTIISRELSPLESAVLTIGQISGGKAPNIIPDSVDLTGMIRTLDISIREEMLKSIDRIAKNIAKGFGGEATVEYTSASPSVVNDKSLTEILINTATRQLGNENVVLLNKPSLGSEDFAYYLQEKPGVFFRLGTSNEMENSKKPLHNPSIVFDENAIFTGIEVICETALNFPKDIDFEKTDEKQKHNNIMR